MSGRNHTRRRVLQSTGAIMAAGLAGCLGGNGNGSDGPGDITNSIDGLTVSDIQLEETTMMGTEMLAVTAVLTNETEDTIRVNVASGTFYDSDGNELETLGADNDSTCISVDPDTGTNGQLIGTPRTEEADTFELTLEESDSNVC